MAHSVGGESSSSSHASDSIPPPWEYDVFLSFAGKDTRLKFVDHLYEAFTRSGIKTYRDDVDLEKGANIKPGLFKAIENSLCAVLIISKSYADSTWCLDELQKILECQITLGRWVFPIFYDVDPGDVRYCRKSFGKALARHEKRFVENTEKVQNWKNVLSDIANLSGWDTRGMHEADLIKNIVGKVWTYLSSKLPSYDDNLVGIDSRVADLIQLLEIGLDETRFVGIWGMGGVGKTTLARVVSEKLSHKFEVSCFLANVRETLQREGLVSLQKILISHLKIQNMEIHDAYEGMKMIRKLLRHKKFLLVIDDLDDMSQLQDLAESPDWFGKGSRVIMTTRDSHLLTSFGVQVIYEMKTMNRDESLQLFSNKAFHKDHPEDNYLELSESVVEYAGGLPLALEVLGHCFCGRSKAEWIDALDRLKQIPDDNKIIKVLKISFDGLNNEKEKEIFLDIACFYKGREKKEVTQILKNCDLNLTIGIKVLIEKGLLVETEDDKLEMHDLLEELGKYIVHQESPNVGERSRLWEFEDIKEVLENNMGSKAIRAIVMHYDSRKLGKIEVHPEAFSKMSNIRLFHCDHYYKNAFVLPKGLKLPRALKVILWSCFSLEALPPETLLDKLVHIGLRGNEIKQLWNGRQVMNKLKIIDLAFSKNLTETPDFSRIPNLEHLCLEWCDSLVKVHESLGDLKALVEVELSFCTNLEILPNKLETNSLVKLDLRWCRKLAQLPEFGEGMKKLSILDVSCTAITRLPESFGSLTGLRTLDFRDCTMLNLEEWGKAHISRQVSGLNKCFLTELNLGWCDLNDGSIFDDFGSLSSSLVVLDLSGNDFFNLPNDSFSSLDRLAVLALNECINLKSLPRLPPRLIRLEAARCDSMEPLSDVQLWNLVASLDNEYRGRNKFVMFGDDIPSRYIKKKESLLLRDFCAIIPAGNKEIPSWFGPNKIYYDVDEYVCRTEREIQVDIPQHFHHNEWSGIVLCFLFQPCYRVLVVNWSSKGAKDDDYIFNDWVHHLGLHKGCQMCMMVLELNEETCWRHLRRSHNNSLHIKLTTYDVEAIIVGCGWRVICKNEIKEHFNQPLLPSPHDITPLSTAMLDRLILSKDEWDRWHG